MSGSDEGNHGFSRACGHDDDDISLVLKDRKSGVQLDLRSSVCCGCFEKCLKMSKCTVGQFFQAFAAVDHIVGLSM